MSNYLVCSSKPWGKYIYEKRLRYLPGKWMFAGSKQLYNAITVFKPDKIFFIHWSDRVIKEITDNYECICFHPSDLPMDRGGTPIQHLIDYGDTETYLSAFRMTQELDAGPIYDKRPLSLYGSAEEIYLRMCRLAAVMIEEWIQDGFPEPEEQGTAGMTVNKRRKPAESELPNASIDRVFRFIQMLDAQDYPHAFIEYNGYRFEFTRPALRTGKIEADVTITPL